MRLTRSSPAPVRILSFLSLPLPLPCHDIHYERDKRIDTCSLHASRDGQSWQRSTIWVHYTTPLALVPHRHCLERVQRCRHTYIYNDFCLLLNIFNQIGAGAAQCELCTIKKSRNFGHARKPAGLFPTYCDWFGDICIHMSFEKEMIASQLSVDTIFSCSHGYNHKKTNECGYERKINDWGQLGI